MPGAIAMTSPGAGASATGKSNGPSMESSIRESRARLSSPYENVRGMRLSLVVETGDGAVDRGFESIGIDDGAIGQIMLLEVAPASFDVVQFGGIFRQPFGGEPRA